MKGLFITYPVNYQKEQSGIKIKIDGQINVFKNNGIDCNEYLLKPSKFCKNIRFLKMGQWIPFFNIWPRWTYSADLDNMDFLYMRKPSTYSSFMIQTLKKVKKNNPNTTIILEIPTYPYDNEMRRGIKRLLLIKEKLYRNKLREVVDYIALPSFGKVYNKIYGIPVIDFYNGNDFSKISVKKHKKTFKELNLICVANFQPTHGYERIIEGVCEYNESNPKIKVILHMVGEGIELQNYKNIALQKDHNNSIVFHGFMCGEDLTKIYDEADVGVSALGLYKINNEHVSCLKNGEYMAKGLPVIYTGDKEDVPNNCKEFFLLTPNMPTSININDVISFYNELVKKYGDSLNEIIRNEAIKYYDISVSMIPVIDIIKKKNIVEVNK